MKALIVTNMYPGTNPKWETQGIFVQEQKNSLEKDHNVDCEVFVIEGFKSKLQYLTSALKLHWHLLFNRYDVIHIHYALSGVFMLLNPFRRKWKNVVVTCHGADIQIQQGGENLVNRISRKVVKRSASVITLNDTMDDIVKPFNDNICRMPCGVETDFFNPNGDKPEHIIVFPGNPENARKNYPLFEKVFNEYKKLVPEAKIAVMWGMNRDQIKQTLESASALLMTSYSEGSPQAVKEALSCDLPVVCSNVGDVSKVFADTPGTAIVELDENPAKIAARLKACISQAQESKAARRERLLSLGFAQKDVTGRLKHLYQSLS